MSNLNFTLIATWIITILLGTLSVYSMESFFVKTTQPSLTCTPNPLTKEQATAGRLSDRDQAKLGSQSDYSLTIFPNEIVSDIFSYCLTVSINDVKSIKPLVKRPAHSDGRFFIPELLDYSEIVNSLKKSIKRCMKLSTMCKKFNTLLTPETIGKFQRNYETYTKDSLVSKLLSEKRYTHGDTHFKYNLIGLILMHAGAETARIDYGNLLVYAIREKYVPSIKTLLNYTNPNVDNSSRPAFFYADTKEIAEILINSGAQVNHTSRSFMPNVLWAIILDQMEPELIQLYLDHGANARALQPYYEYCLLHKLAQIRPKINFPDRSFEQAKILLKVIPDMINTIDDCGKTPLDYVQESVKWRKGLVFEKLIQLFKDYGAFTAQELAQQKEIAKTRKTKKDKKQKCIIY